MSTVLFVGVDFALPNKILAKKVKIQVRDVSEVMQLQPYNSTDILLCSNDINDGKAPFSYLYYFDNMWTPFDSNGNDDGKKFISYFNELYSSTMKDNFSLSMRKSFYIVLDNYAERKVIAQKEISIKDIDENTKLDFRVLYKVVQ